MGMLAKRARVVYIEGHRDMNKVEKMDCRANGEVIFCAMSLPLSQGPNISDPISQRIGLTGKKNGYAIQSFKPRTTNCLDRDI